MLSELRIFADRDGLHEMTPWVLIEADGSIVETGVGASSAPHAAQALLIIPDDVVSVLAAPLPKLSARQLKEALPAAVEDQLMTPIEKTDLALLSHRSKAPSIIAAWETDWRDALLDSPCVASTRSLRVVAESWGMSLGDDETGLLWNGKRCVLRLPDWTTCIDECEDGPTPPAIIEHMLRQTTADSTAPLRFFITRDGPASIPAWAEHLGRPVECMPPFDWRTASYSSAPSLYSRTRLYLDPAVAMNAFRLPAAVAMVWLIFEIVAMTIDWSRLALEKRQLQTAQEKIFRSTMGETAAMVDGAVQLQRRLDELRATVGAAGSQDILVLLTRIGSHLDSGTPPLAEIRHENGQLLLLPQSAANAPAWKAIAQSAGFDAVVEDSARGMVRITP